MTKRIHEAGTLSVAADGSFRVLLISEGTGSSADYRREFFTQKNAEALAGNLSFPKHPADLMRPEHRDPMSAIGSIDETVTIEEHDGKLGFWSRFIPAKSKPEVQPYLAEYGHKLGLSVYQDCDGYDENGTFIAEALIPDDAYRSVDLVVAPGARGGFEKVAEAKKFVKVSESLGLVVDASATAEEKEENLMEIKELADKVDGLKVLVEALTKIVADGKIAEAQVEVDAAAVSKAVEAKVAAYTASEKLIADAKLTESQSADLRALALTGEDIAPAIEKAKAVLAEALTLAGVKPEDLPGVRKVTEHLGATKTDGDFSVDIPGFGKVA